MPSLLPGPVHAAAHARLGVFSLAELTAAGVTEREVRSAVRAGDWVRLRRGWFIGAGDLVAAEATGRRHTVDVLAVTGALARPTAVLSHATAARIWGLPVPAGSPADVRLTDPDRWRRGPGYVMAHADLPDVDVTTAGRHRLTTVARTLVDNAREWSELAAVAAMDVALLRGMVTEGGLQATLGRHRFAPRNPRAVRAVAAADGRAETWLETKGRLRFRAAGLPPFVPQVELWVGDRLLKVADGWYEEAAVVVEFDGRVKYVRPAYGGRPEDVLFEEKRTEDALRAVGVRFVRLVNEDLGPGWAPVEDRVRRELRVPGPAVRSFRAVPRSVGRCRAVG